MNAERSEERSTKLGSAWRAAGTVRSRAKSGGYTLVELLIVVAMIGVLAALAILGYRKYLLSSQASEARGVIGAIRNAEEAYKSETLVYLGCTTGYAPLYPNAAPNNTKWAWNNPAAAKYSCWQQLNVVTDAPVIFGYAVDAGIGGVPATLPTVSQPTWPTIVDPWFVTLAVADRDNDGVKAYFEASSFTGEIYYENDTE